MKRAADAPCAMLMERLSAYLDGDLSAASCRAIERHAASCPRCTGILDDLRRTVGLCQKAASAPLPDAVRRRARSRIKALIGRRASARR